MGLCKKTLYTSLVIGSSLLSFAFADLALESKEPVQKNHLLYLIRSNKITSCIDLYKEYKKTLGKHDSEILEQMALILFDQGMASHEEEKELISLYGASLAGVNSILDLCEIGLKSHHPTTELVSIQMAGQIQDDRANQLLCKAFSSDFLAIRMEAASYLAQKKHLHAVGYIESLMHKLPPFFHCFFSEMYAQIGSVEAMTILKKMIHSGELHTRIAATLSAAHYKRDDLIKDIRTAATHLNPAEQEACAFALGTLSDSHSISILETMAKSSESEVSLAACLSLFHLGKKNYIEEIKKAAKNNNFFAIGILGSIDSSEDHLVEDLLYELTKSSDKQIKYNAALALLKKRDLRCINTITTLLLSKNHDLGFLPHYSLGRSMMHWKTLPSLSVHSKGEKGSDLLAISLALREQTLVDCLELGEKPFLSIAREILNYQQKDLIPALMHLLCNIESPACIALLKDKAEEMGSPFIRNYACLALVKLKSDGPYQQRIEKWISTQKETEMIQFRPITTKTSSETSFTYQLTPKENSALLVEVLMLIASSHEENGLDLLLEMIKTGNPKNRPILAGLLMKALE